MGEGEMSEWDLALGMDHDIILELILDVGMEPFSIHNERSREDWD